MRDDHPVFRERLGKSEVIATQGAMLMARGAIIGAAIFFGLLIFIWVLTLISSWLPPQSKEMPDPNILQRGALEQPLEVRTV